MMDCATIQENINSSYMKNIYVNCPICKKKMYGFSVLEETEVKNLKIFCKFCKNQFLVDIGKTEEKEQFPDITSVVYANSI